jgi:hypothetical protein
VREVSQLQKLELRGPELVLTADAAVTEAAEQEHADDLMAVAELMAKQGLQGDPSE